MPSLNIHNPFTGAGIDTIPADDAASVATKAAAAKAAQPAWAVITCAEAGNRGSFIMADRTFAKSSRTRSCGSRSEPPRPGKPPLAE